MTVDNSTNLEINGGTIAGSAIGGSGNQVRMDNRHLINQVAQSSRTADEVKTLLQQLAVALDAIQGKLPKAVADQVKRDLETLVQEVSSPEPRPQWWQLSLEGLKKAATDIGEIGKPVLEVAARIVEVLNR